MGITLRSIAGTWVPDASGGELEIWVNSKEFFQALQADAEVEDPPVPRAEPRYDQGYLKLAEKLLRLSLLRSGSEWHIHPGGGPRRQRRAVTVHDGGGQPHRLPQRRPGQPV